MKPSIIELDYQQTPLGELILRRRRSPSLNGQDVFEVKLNDEFLMSSVVTASEEALATLALDAWGDRMGDVLIGGLGLGYTAAAVLRSKLVRRVEVIELLEPIIDWYHRRLLPVSHASNDDPRLSIVHADFFRHIAETAHVPHRCYDLILLDIDHSPESCLHESHESFYWVDGLMELAASLTPGGIFGLWSAKSPSPAFIQRLKSVFHVVNEYPINYYHPMLHQPETNIVVIAQRPVVAGSQEVRHETNG